MAICSMGRYLVQRVSFTAMLSLSWRVLCQMLHAAHVRIHMQLVSLRHLKDAMEELCQQFDITTLNPKAIQSYLHTMK